jgi:hypothetical protein
MLDILMRHLLQLVPVSKYPAYKDVLVEIDCIAAIESVAGE